MNTVITTVDQVRRLTIKAKSFEVSITENGNMCAIPVPFDPKVAFGKIRAPVKVTINKFTFRSTISKMSGNTFIPLRKSNREAARVKSGDRVKVKVEADLDERDVEVPADLRNALRAEPGAWQHWKGLSYTNRKEDVEAVLNAKKPETRLRRINKILSRITSVI